MITSQPTLQSNNALYIAWRFKDEMKRREFKRKFIGHCIRFLLVISIGLICWHFKPVPFAHGQGVFLEKSSFDNKTPVVQTSHGDR